MQIKKYIGFNVPAWTLIAVGACTFLAGIQLGTIPSNGKVVSFARNRVIFEAVQVRPGASEEILQKEVVVPINAFIKGYQNEGYAVIDTSIDADGQMAVLALPKGSIDVSDQISKALAPAKK